MKKLLVALAVALSGTALIAPTIASAQPHHRGHQVCHWGHHHHRECHWVR